MAIAFARVSTHSRASGHSAVAAAAYRTRSRLTDERTGEVFDWSDRAEELEATRMVLPNVAKGWKAERLAAGRDDAAIRGELWNAVEAGEKRHDARIGRDMTVAMPWELTKAQRARVSYEIAKFITDGHEFTHTRTWRENGKKLSEIVPMKGHGVAVEYAMHLPHEKADDLNYHTHFQISPRRMDASGFTEKARELDNPKTSGPQIEAWRAGAQRIINRALERAGYDQSHFIDMRSYERQGIDRAGQIHLGPQAAAMERAGVETGAGTHNRDIAERNAAIARHEKRETLTDRVNVIDFEEKLLQRDRRRHQDIQYRHARLRAGHLRKNLHRLTQIENEVIARREKREQSEALIRAFEEAADRETDLQTYQEALTREDISNAQTDERERSEEEGGRSAAAPQSYSREAETLEQLARLDEAAMEYAREIEATAAMREAEEARLLEAQREERREMEKNEARAALQSYQSDREGEFGNAAASRRMAFNRDMREHYANDIAAWRDEMTAIDLRQREGGVWYKMRHARADRARLDELGKQVETAEQRLSEAQATFNRSERETRAAFRAEQSRERDALERHLEKTVDRGLPWHPRPDNRHDPAWEATLGTMMHLAANDRHRPPRREPSRQPRAGPGRGC